MNTTTANPISRRLTQLAIAALVPLALTGCERGASDESGAGSTGSEAAPDEATATDSEAAPDDEATAAASARTELAVWRPLLDEAARAELDAGGLFVDLGSVDGHKYTRGGWRNAWGHNEATEAETYAPILETEATIERPAHHTAPLRRVVTRVRSRCPGQRMNLSLDGAERGEPIEVGEAWQRVEIIVPEAQAGARALTLTATETCSSGALHVDWLWLATTGGGDPPETGPRHAPLALQGRSRRALQADSPRSLAFYLEPPEGAALVFDHGATGDAELVVTAERDGAPARELWRASTTAADGWREARVDLSDFAGHPTRLTLTVESVADGAVAGVAEPDVMVARAQVAGQGGGGFGAEPRGAIVIAVDGLGADADGPTLERLADEGVRFVAAHANGTWARPSAASLLSSLYPSAHGAHGQASRLSDDIELLPERLEQDGVESAGFVVGGAVATEFGFGQGWRDYEVATDATATALYERALAWLDQHPDAPFFVYLEPTDPQRAAAGGQDVAEAVAAHDTALGRFVDALEERALLDETLLVVTGSHGTTAAKAAPLSPEVLHVPLVMRLPDVLPAGRAIAEPVEGVDVAPTVLELLGLPPSELHQGISLVPVVEGDPVQRPLYALGMDGDRAVVIHVGQTRLSTDPAAAAAPGPIARRLAEVHLGEALANETKRRRLDDVRHDLRFDSVEVDMDPALKKQLEALGYFGD